MIKDKELYKLFIRSTRTNYRHGSALPYWVVYRIALSKLKGFSWDDVGRRNRRGRSQNYALLNRFEAQVNMWLKLISKDPPKI